MWCICLKLQQKYFVNIYKDIANYEKLFITSCLTNPALNETIVVLILKQNESTKQSCAPC